MTIHCEHCARPITAGTGHINLYDDELDLAERQATAHEAAQATAAAILDPFAGTVTVDDLLRAPQPAKWHAEHDRCATGARDAYAIAVERISTLDDALSWTLHLMGKTWIQRTDWAPFIRKQLPAAEGSA